MTKSTVEHEHKSSSAWSPCRDISDNPSMSLGYQAELVRNRSTFQVAFMSFVLTSIPYGLATTLSYPLVGGGPVNIVWGWLAVSLIILCVAASLDEITSVYPTAGGVCYQTFMLTPPRWRRIASWSCGWLYVVGNISITLSVNFATALFFVGCINVFEKSPGVGVMSGESYQIFSLFLGVTIVFNIVSAFANSYLPLIDTIAVFWTFVGVIAIVVCVLAIAKNGRHHASWVFTHFEDSSGWPKGWSFCVGLLHAAYATSSTGMIVSMCEEVRKPSIQVPRAMVATVCINTLVGLLFLIPLVYVLPDIQGLIIDAQPVPAILKSAIGNPGGTFGLLIPLMILGIICGIGCTTATSRCVWAFARDGAIPDSIWWARVDRKLDVPLNAMILSAVIEIILSLIYFGSSAAFNTFSGVGIICLTSSYATPITISFFTGRTQVKAGNFHLGRPGYVANAVVIAWSALALPLFCMPSVIPVTSEAVNYAPVVFVFACGVSGIWYWVWGYNGVTKTMPVLLPEDKAPHEEYTYQSCVEGAGWGGITSVQ